MNLKPWREIAQPHPDVLSGSLKQSEFAADLTLVASQKANVAYQDAAKFFERTFITEGMRLLLCSILQRLNGQGGDPVIQLQTAFGGGKTHTLLAVYHLVKQADTAHQLQGIPPLLDETGITQLPKANIAIIDGNHCAVSQAAHRDGLQIRTLWGDLAHQLGGVAGYQLVADSDQKGTSPGKACLIELLEQTAPCVILMDELVAFLRQMKYGEQYVAGSFESNISFFQALTEAIKAVPNAMLLASLPESNLEVGGPQGEVALQTLEKYFGRLEAVWKPVAAEEAFKIVRQRLFANAGAQKDIDQTCRGFIEFYRAHPSKFPSETQSNEYFDRLCQAYPIHPEIFDRLYEDWSTLETFQRTRGILQLMAVVVFRLWNAGNSDPLIMPGSLPLADSQVRNKSIHYLPQGWEPVLEREIDGPNSLPQRLENNNTHFGGIQAASRTTRTIFLGSAPSNNSQLVRGIRSDRILLGAAAPNHNPGTFEDVLKRLRDQLHYLYADTMNDAFWFDTKPNLRREMEARKSKLSEQEDVLPKLQTELKQVIGKSFNYIVGAHIFTDSADVPDEYGNGLRLVILPPNAAYNRINSNNAYQAAEQILFYRGEQPRQKRNRLLFLAPELDSISRLKEQVRTLLAWQSIVTDIRQEVLNHDITHLKQAENQLDQAKLLVKQLTLETYKWLILPSEKIEKDRPQLKWEAFAVEHKKEYSFVQAIEATAKAREHLTDEWGAFLLQELLEKWYFKAGVTEVSALKVWQDCCCYLYLPRLITDKVLINTIRKGIATEEFFGFAQTREADHYIGFCFGKEALVQLAETSLLIERNAALAYAEKIAAPPPPPASPNNIAETSSPFIATQPSPNTPTQPSGKSNKHRFYGEVKFEPARNISTLLTTMLDEVLQHFLDDPHTKLDLTLNIEATHSNGFDEALQRTVRENCNSLKFKVSSFEE